MSESRLRHSLNKYLCGRVAPHAPYTFYLLAPSLLFIIHRIILRHRSLINAVFEVYNTRNRLAMCIINYPHASKLISTCNAMHQLCSGDFSDEERKGFIKESVLMYKFDHPNVLTLLGLCLDAGPSPYIVMPFMENGSLLSYVRKNKAKLLVSSEIEEEKVCTV